MRTLPRLLNRNTDTPPKGEENVSRLPLQSLQAEEQERKRISRELHDGTGQSLMVLRLQLGALGSNKDSEVAAKVQEALAVLDQLIEDVRRIIGRLSPRVLEELGLIAAIRSEVREWSKRTGLQSQLKLPSSLAPIAREFEIAIYRVLQEALHNIAKHSHAQKFIVKLEQKKNRLCLEVEDDGRGFSASSSSRPHTYGLSGVRERTAALGGKVRVRSSRGAGTTISVSFPLRTTSLAGKSEALTSQVATRRTRASGPVTLPKTTVVAKAG